MPELDSLLIGFLDYQKKGLWRFRDIPLIGHPDEFEKIAHMSLDPILSTLIVWDLNGVLITSDENIEDVKRIAIAYLMMQS